MKGYNFDILEKQAKQLVDLSFNHTHSVHREYKKHTHTHTHALTHTNTHMPVRGGWKSHKSHVDKLHSLHTTHDQKWRAKQKRSSIWMYLCVFKITKNAEDERTSIEGWNMTLCCRNRSTLLVSFQKSTYNFRECGHPHNRSFYLFWLGFSDSPASLSHTI